MLAEFASCSAGVGMAGGCYGGWCALVLHFHRAIHEPDWHRFCSLCSSTLLMALFFFLVRLPDIDLGESDIASTRRCTRFYLLFDAPREGKSTTCVVHNNQCRARAHEARCVRAVGHTLSISDTLPPSPSQLLSRLSFFFA